MDKVYDYSHAPALESEEIWCTMMLEKMQNTNFGYLQSILVPFCCGAQQRVIGYITREVTFQEFIELEKFDYSYVER